MADIDIDQLGNTNQGLKNQLIEDIPLDPVTPGRSST